MSYQDNNKPYVQEPVRTSQGSGSSMALIVGGLVVAVAFILWLVFGGTAPVTTTGTTTVPANDTTNVTVEPAAPADSTTNVTVDPEADAPAATAPTAPADDPAAPAPADDPAAAPAAPVEE